MALGDSNRGNGVWAQNAAMQAAQAQGALSESVGNYFDAKARLKQAKAELAQLDSWINYSKELEKKLEAAVNTANNNNRVANEMKASHFAFKRVVKIMLDSKEKMTRDAVSELYQKFLKEEDAKMGL